MGPGVHFDKQLDAYVFSKKGSQCVIRPAVAWADLSAFLRAHRVDSMLMQAPSMATVCNYNDVSELFRRDPAYTELMPLVRQLQPSMTVVRRSSTGYAESSVDVGHCLHDARKMDRLERALEHAIEVSDSASSSLSRRQPTLPRAAFPSERGWRRFADNTFQVFHLTRTLYSVEPSDGVHVTAGGNAVLAHVLVTHLASLMS